MKHILIVEDEQYLAEAIRAYFEELDMYTLTLCNTVPAAIEFLESQTPDLLLLDLIMPEQDGRQLLRYLQDQGQSIPTIVASNLDGKSVVEECKQLGADRVLVKSNMSLHALANEIKGLLGEG